MQAFAKQMHWLLSETSMQGKSHLNIMFQLEATTMPQAFIAEPTKVISSTTLCYLK